MIPLFINLIHELHAADTCIHSTACSFVGDSPGQNSVSLHIHSQGQGQGWRHASEGVMAD